MTVMLAAGVLLVAFGAWQAYEPAGWMVVGVAMVVAAVRYGRTL
jgi:hypothetical protein